MLDEIFDDHFNNPNDPGVLTIKFFHQASYGSCFCVITLVNGVIVNIIKLKHDHFMFLGAYASNGHLYKVGEKLDYKTFCEDFRIYSIIDKNANCIY